MLKNMLTITAFIAASCLSCSLLAAQSPAGSTQNSIVKEDVTPPAAEGPLPASEIQPLMLSDKSKPQEPNSTTQVQPLSTTAPTPTS